MDSLMETMLPNQNNASKSGTFKPAKRKRSNKQGQMIEFPTTRDQRLQFLAERLATSSVQLPAAAENIEEPARLSSEDIANVFISHVPGVRNFLYRDTPGQHSLSFIQQAYANGLKKFQGTSLNSFYTGLLRLIVHHGYADQQGCAGYLFEVAEAFKDCQDVQARVIERVGLQIRGVTLDFRGHLVKLVGDYKNWALKMLAFEQTGSSNTIHFENHCALELGDRLGLNKADMQRAEHDEEVGRRFTRMREPERLKLACRFRDLLDMEALLKAIAAEINSFSESSPAESMARHFVSWASQSMSQPHLLLDDTSFGVEVENDVVLAILEVVFLGKTFATESELIRGSKICDAFKRCDE
eukprot:gnl/MRDRNA2_/MRDRNA2_89963_c0_seq1.p1 gnl/MRDRNA2_/MRDRNA2_89963_c0~~gnl/MRDRNA2_/MRDRNA2_89963_c0_seq1.p1  ORF type:complete len:393 (+),score=69.36 gnl/MRDRNA2_/MRDRNA2_89963_c0_seq1:113-1180(+)